MASGIGVGCGVGVSCRRARVDQICDRRNLRGRIASLLAILMKQPRPEADAEAAA